MIKDQIDWLRYGGDSNIDGEGRPMPAFYTKMSQVADTIAKMEAALVVARKLIYIVVAREVILQDGYDVDKHPVIMQIDAALGK